MIIGITGTIGAGKGAVVDYLKAKGFAHFSARDILNDELTVRGLAHERENMAMLADELRRVQGHSYILEQLYAKAEASGGDAIVESIRNLGEIEFLRTKPDFHLVAVDAPQELRYQRLAKRGSSTDDVSLERFRSQEERESKGNEPWTQNLPACIAEAEVVFQNDGTIEELQKQIDTYLDKIGNK